MPNRMPARPSLLVTSAPKPSTRQLVAEGIRRESGARGINMITMSRLTGLGYKRVQDIFHGRRILIDDLATIAAVLSVPASMFLPSETA